MPNELDLPLTGDGKGYLKEDVEKYVEEVNDSPRRILEQAQTILESARNQADETIAEAEKLAAEKTEGLDTIREETIQLAELEAEEIRESAKKDTTELRETANLETKELRDKTEKEARSQISAADKKATHTIEQAMSKVHALIKTAHGKVEAATNRANEMDAESNRQFAEATAHIGSLVVDADGYRENEISKADVDAENLRLDAETMLAYAKEETRLIRESAKNDAERIVREATEYRDQIADWTTSELSSARNIIAQYKTFYDDNISRLVAIYDTNLTVARQLADVQFPDGENLVPSEDYSFTSDEDRDTKDDSQIGESSIDIADEAEPVLIYNEEDSMLADNGQEEVLDPLVDENQINPSDTDDADYVTAIDLDAVEEFEDEDEENHVILSSNAEDSKADETKSLNLPEDDSEKSEMENSGDESELIILDDSEDK